MASDRPPVLRARYLFPVDGPPIAGGVVTIAGGKIAAVGAHQPGTAVQDLGDVAILPGLVNAHTHLEFSDLDAPIGQPGIQFSQWIPMVVDHRRKTAANQPAPVEQGLRESLRSGVTALGEIATADWPQVFDASAPTTVVCRELKGPTSASVPNAESLARTFLSAAPFDSHRRPALSPHAPYTVHTRLLTALVELAREFNVPLAMHLAESHDELELIAQGTGGFRDAFERLGIWDAAPDARYPRVIHYLEQLAQAPRALVIHGNYLTDDDTKFIAERRDRMTVVYCARTHDFLRLKPYPLARWLAAGVPLALGTDSRASNPDLNLFEEMKFVAARHPQVAPSTVLELGTIGSARALGLDNEMGSLAVGKLANFAIVGPITRDAADPHEPLFDANVRVLQTWMDGKLVYEGAEGVQ